MEGQNKRTGVEIECCECGDVATVSPTYADAVDLERFRCSECEEGIDA